MGEVNADRRGEELAKCKKVRAAGIAHGHQGLVEALWHIKLQMVDMFSELRVVDQCRKNGAVFLDIGNMLFGVRHVEPNLPPEPTSSVSVPISVHQRTSKDVPSVTICAGGDKVDNNMMELRTETRFRGTPRGHGGRELRFTT